MLQAWSIYLVIDSAFTAFGENEGFATISLKLGGGFINETPAPDPLPWTKAFIIIALLVLEAASATYAFASPEGDLIANITITWVLHGLARRKFPTLLLGALLRD